MLGWMVVGPNIWACFVRFGWKWRTRRAAGHAHACLFQLQLVFKLVGLALIFRGGTKIDGAIAFYTTIAAACLCAWIATALWVQATKQGTLISELRGEVLLERDMNKGTKLHARRPAVYPYVYVGTIYLTYTPHARAHISFHKKN
jgi:hypothetical protein